MLAIAANKKAVREALAREGWRFMIVSSVREMKQHGECRTLGLPVGSESDDHSRTIRERLIRQLPWEMRGQPSPRWLTYLSSDARKRLQPHLPLAAEFCLIHGFVFLVGNLWAERHRGRWITHREDGPAVICEDREQYYWHGWQVSKDAVRGKVTADRILKEQNQTEREVLMERMGVENFVNDAGLRPIDSFRDTTLLKVNTAETRDNYQNGRWVRAPMALAFLRVICPSTQKTYFLRVDPDVRHAKEALESTLPGYRRDWEQDLVQET